MAKKNKAIVAGALAVGMLAGGTGTMALHTGFSDVKENAWYSDAIHSLSEQGIIGGYDDGTFRPNEEITRAEVASMLYRMQQTEDGDTPLNPPVEPEPEPEPTGNPLSDVTEYEYYLDSGSEEIAQKMASEDLVIVEPVVMQDQYIQTAQEAGTEVFGYINSMEADEWNQELFQQFNEEDFYHDENGDRVYIDQWNAYLMNINSEHYQDVLIGEIGKQIADRGLDGVFLDTVGNIDDRFDGAERELMQESMAQFMQRIQDTYPDLLIGQNWGFDTLKDHTGQYVDLMMWENFDPSYPEPSSWYKESIQLLKDVRAQHGTEIFVVSFEGGNAEQVAAEHGFKYEFHPAGSYYNQWSDENE